VIILASSENTNFFTPKLYDRLKFIAQIVLPAVATFWLTVSELWNIPNGPEIAGTITAFDLLLGILLGVSRNQYYKNGANFDGELKMVETEDGNEKVVFDVNSDPETVLKNFGGKHTFEFKVNRRS
jgi:hypothetical protein